MENFPEGKFLTTVKIGPKDKVSPCSRFLIWKRCGMPLTILKTEMKRKNECA